ncbi:MAG: ATP-dependent zinc metalloprotease FtsH [Streptosporangiaceae bacterium]
MSKTPAAPPPGDKPVRTAPPQPPGWRHWLWLLWLVVILLWVVPAFVHRTPQTVLTYSQFTGDVAAHKVKSVSIPSPSAQGANVTVTGTFAGGKDFSVVTPAITPGAPLADSLKSAGVAITYQAPGSSLGGLLLEILIFLVLPFAVLIWLFRRMARTTGSSLQGVMGVGRSRAKVFDAERPDTHFGDVAGYDGAKAEISEVVDFLRSPDRYQRAGAMAPRGVLMVGPPGTGKTLLARAVAGEASVPFFSVAGSSFVEMFVGVGAARVRDLFAEARKQAPAIIFVDEIDAIGQRRAGSGAFVANDEREQTLNQLLSELDGFDPRSGIVVLGATNRPEVLDPALLRPGRFDRQVVIPLPTLDERKAILAVHCRDKKLGQDVDLEIVARGTPGFSGADLANLANEAAIFAVRDGRQVLSAADFENARDRILLGRREGSNVLLPEEKHAVAVHEAGHALVAAFSEHADPVAKVTILPAGQALGVTQQLPLYERHLYGQDYLTESLAVRLGGRAAELVELGQGSTGAANDLASATELATKMVREFGLSDKLGPIGYPQGGSVFLGDGAGGGGFSSRPFAEATQANIDAEVARLVRDAEQTAVSLIRAHTAELDQLVALLLAKETVDGTAVYAIAGRPVPERRADQLTIAPHGASAAAPPPGALPRGAGGQEHDVDG